MDAILVEQSQSQGFTFIQDLEMEIEEEYSHHVSIWIKEKDIVRASTNVTMSNKLEPGVYIAEYNRDVGYFCQKLEYESDNLFMFSDSITDELFEEIETFWSKKDLFEEHKLIHKRGILLEGFPGTGKSSIITQLSNQVIAKGGIVFKVQGIRNLETYINFIRFGLRKIQSDTPLITIIEDIDQYGEVEAELLDFLDGKSSFTHHVVIATSNNTENIPDTFLRPSRFDIKIEIPFPTIQTRREYFEFKKVPEELIPELVKESEDCSLADLKEIYTCIFLLGYSMVEAITQVKEPRTKKNYLAKSARHKKMGI